MASPAARQIEWGSARVKDGTLSVKLTGSSSKDWTERFESVLTLLGSRHSAWGGDVCVTNKRITVAGVQPGTETEARHFLESVVFQTNSDFESPTQEGGADAEGEDEPATADERMTAVCRGFANGTSAPAHNGRNGQTSGE